MIIQVIIQIFKVLQFGGIGEKTVQAYLGALKVKKNSLELVL